MFLGYFISCLHMLWLIRFLFLLCWILGLQTGYINLMIQAGGIHWQGPKSGGAEETHPRKLVVYGTVSCCIHVPYDMGSQLELLGVLQLSPKSISNLTRKWIDIYWIVVNLGGPHFLGCPMAPFHFPSHSIALNMLWDVDNTPTVDRHFPS